MKRVLIINVARYGDTLLTTPVITALKAAHPACNITYLAHPHRMEVLTGHPQLTTLAGITKKAALWRGWWPGKRFDVALVYGRDKALFRYAMRVSQRVVGFRQGDPALDRQLVEGGVSVPVDLHAVEERLLLLRPLGISPAGRQLSYFPSDDELAKTDLWLAEKGLADAPLIGLQLQSFPGKAYRDWPPGHFAQLIAALHAVCPEFRFILLGGPESRTVAQTLAATCGPHVVVAAGIGSFRQSAALIARLAMYVGVDTGPTHLAGALGVPMVAMYHCYHPGRLLAPLDRPRLRVIEHPASKERCSRQTPMAEISVDRVLAEVRTLWNECHEDCLL